jgi:hypothetical protein
MITCRTPRHASVSLQKHIQIGQKGVAIEIGAGLEFHRAGQRQCSESGGGGLM